MHEQKPRIWTKVISSSRFVGLGVFLAAFLLSFIGLGIKRGLLRGSNWFKFGF